MATGLSNRIRNTALELRSRLEGRTPLAAGILAGLLGLVVSYALKGLIPARPLGDPLPMMLALAGLTRGFAYLPWQPALLHLLFAIFVGLLAVAVLRVTGGGLPSREQARYAGRTAALINVAVVAVLAVDALIVGFWYLISGWASILVSGFVAGRLASRLQRPSQSVE